MRVLPHSQIPSTKEKIPTNYKPDLQEFDLIIFSPHQPYLTTPLTFYVFNTHEKELDIELIKFIQTVFPELT